MEKTEMMKQIEREAELTATIQTGTCGELPRWWYVFELERQLEKMQAKATAYDRLMSGGKKTLKELANMFGMVVAVDQNGEASCFGHIPVMYLDEGIWANSPKHYGEETYLLPPHLIDFDGDWRDSLTMPDGWEEP